MCLKVKAIKLQLFYFFQTAINNNFYLNIYFQIHHIKFIV